MPKKLTLLEAVNIFKSKGLLLTEPTYVNSKTKMYYECVVCGYVNKTTLTVARLSKGCPSCLGNVHMYRISDVIHCLNSDGYELLSTEYIDFRQRLLLKCSRGHVVTIAFRDWIQGCRCRQCYLDDVQPDIAEVTREFDKAGYILHTKSYTSSTTKLKYTCNIGHDHVVSWGNFKNGTRCPTCYTNNYKGNKVASWRGGVTEKNLPLYETYSSQLDDYNEVHKVVREGLDLLGVECAYCGGTYVPTRQQVVSRLGAIKGKYLGDHGLYCSENCKKSCPTFGQKKFPKGFKLATSREVQSQLRKLVLKRDRYTCQICEAGSEETQLHCHHITGVELNPIESADIDNCITLCKYCHKKVHKLPDCGYHELKCTNFK